MLYSRIKLYTLTVMQLRDAHVCTNLFAERLLLVGNEQRETNNTRTCDVRIGIIIAVAS